MLLLADKAMMLATLVGFHKLGACAKSCPRNYSLLRKRVISNTDVLRVQHALQNTLRLLAQAKYNSTSQVRHVATKLSEIIGNFQNSIIRTKIVLCMDVAAYPDVQWMCL